MGLSVPPPDRKPNSFMRRIVRWAKTWIPFVLIAAVCAFLVPWLASGARWATNGLLTHVLPGHATAWLGATVYWIVVIVGVFAAVVAFVIVDRLADDLNRADRVSYPRGSQQQQPQYQIQGGGTLTTTRSVSREATQAPPDPPQAEKPTVVISENRRLLHIQDTVRRTGMLDPDLLDDIVGSDPAEYVNFDFLDITESVERTLDLHEGLYAGLDYKLVVGMGTTPDVRLAGGDQERVERPAEEKVVLDVVLVVAENLEILKESWATLEWPKSGPSLNNAEFPLRPLAAGPARVKVLIYFEHDLLFCGDLELEVRSEGDEWPGSERPIRWKTMDPEKAAELSLFRRFRDLDREARRRVNISVHRRTTEIYDVVFFLRSTEPVPRAYPLRVEISDREISAFLARARSALRLLTASHEAPESDAYSAGKFLDDMSLLGSELWNKLFGSETGQRLAAILNQELSEEGAIVQVWNESAASDFVLPWVWIYPLPVVPGKQQQTDSKQFWGYRYVIEQLRQLSGEKRPASVVAGEPLRIAAALHNFTAAAAEREFFSERSAKYSTRLTWAEIKPADWRDFLSKCDAHLVYFYCHGHTEQPLSVVDAEILRTLQRLAATSPTETAAWIESLNAEQRKRVRGQSVIAIEKETLNMVDLSQFKPADPSLRPVVFLNMCESAEFYPGATDNLVDVFLRRGARGVIGTEVPVLAAFGDTAARGFFEAFFGAGRSGEGQEIGTVLWQIRRSFLDQGNPLGFVYTYFGDATTRLKPAIIDSKSQVAVKVDGGDVHGG
jgi:hypothetical protein